MPFPLARQPENESDHVPGRRESMRWQEKPDQLASVFCYFFLRMTFRDGTYTGFNALPARGFAHPACSPKAIPRATHEAKGCLFVSQSGPSSLLFHTSIFDPKVRVELPLNNRGLFGGLFQAISFYGPYWTINFTFTTKNTLCIRYFLAFTYVRHYIDIH